MARSGGWPWSASRCSSSKTEGFYEQLLASQPDPATGKPDPAKMKDFVAHHPETARALQIVQANPFSSGFANSGYNSLHAFRFVNAGGVATPVRWSMAAVDPFEPEPPARSAAQDKNYLFDAVIARIGQAPVEWRLVVTIGQPADPTDDATIPWPSKSRAYRRRDLVDQSHRGRSAG